MQERRALSANVYGLDNDIITRLFSLDRLSTERLFTTIQQHYGWKAAQYAREAWPFWKNKTRGISGLNAGRFISLAPRVFSFDDRYELVAKLYERTRRPEYHRLTAILGVHEGAIRDLQKLFERLCQKPSEHRLPESVAMFAAWVADNDAIIAGKLIAALETKRSVAIVKAARVECARLIACIRNPSVNLIGSHEIVLPYGTIVLDVRKPNVIERLKQLF
jgi:hypothetical protein